MNGDELKEALHGLRTLQLETVRNTERIEGRIATLDERQDRFEANLDGALTCIRDNSQQISNVKQACMFHQDETKRQGKRVSELVRKVGGAEVTGAIQIATLTQTWRTIAVAAAAVAALAGLVIALLK